MIERVTFHNEETGFAVLRVKVKGQRDLVTVIGSLPAVTAGEWLTAEGRWVRDKDHGLQLKADFLKCSEPTSIEGIEKYLGSGLIKGIGPVYAKKLVARFGEKVFEVIEQTSAQLEQIDGIGPGRRRKIKEAWAEQRVIRDIMIFLHSHGVGTSRATRIYKTYGETAIETVRSNPYLLAQDIPGIGFKTADQVAQRLGIPADSLIRARAGLRHTLLEATGAGHCALPRELLLEQTARALEVARPIVDEALARLTLDAEAIEDTITGEPLIFLPALRDAEEGIAARITALAASPPSYPDIDLEKAIAWCEQKTGTVLAPSQRAAIAEALTHRVLVITGGPGVGKTTLVNSLLAILRAKKISCLLCAPTGRAAKRLTETTGLEAKTIHRLLEAQPGGGFVRGPDRPLECDLLVVDETSMVDVPLFPNSSAPSPPAPTCSSSATWINFPPSAPVPCWPTSSPASPLCASPKFSARPRPAASSSTPTGSTKAGCRRKRLAIRIFISSSATPPKPRRTPSSRWCATVSRRNFPSIPSATSRSSAP